MPESSTINHQSSIPLLSRHPAVGLGIAFVLGTALGLTLDVSAVVIAAAAAVGWLGAAALAWIGRARKSGAGGAVPLFTHFSVVLLAWLSVLLHPTDSPADARLLAEMDDKRLDVVGVVAGDPDAALAQEGGLRRWKLPLAPLEVRCEGVPRPFRARVKVLWLAPHGMRPPAYGERWALSGKARVYPVSGVRRKTLYLSVMPRDRELLSPDGGAWFAQRCYDARRAAAEYLAVGIRDRPVTVGILQSLILGYRERLTDEMEGLFAASGTLHIFAISGSHVVVICGLMVFVLRALRVPRMLWVWLLGPLLAAYTLATGGEPSAVRACIMAIAYFLAPALGRKPDIASTLALAAVAILAWSPAQLFEAGFVCSFVVVIGLVALCPSIERPLRRLLEADPLRLQPEARRSAFLRWLGRQATGLLALNVAAWVASAPLTARYFSRFTPIALLSNLFVIPLSAVSILAGCLSVVLGPCLALAADVFNHANVFLAGALVKGVRALLKLPGGSVQIEPWSLAAVALWYVIAAAGVFWLRGKELDTAAAE